MLDRFEHFTYLVNKIYRDMQKIKSQKLKNYGLKGSHMICIHYLGKSDDGLSFKELCEICDEDKGLISRNLSYLKKEDFVEELIGDKKTYKGKMILTEKGKEVFDAIQGITINICQQVYLDKEKTSLDSFYTNLEGISERIERIVNQGK